MKAVGYIILTIVVGAWLTIVCGFTLSKLWMWFVVPQFDLKPLGLVEAAGLAIMVGYVSCSHREKVESNNYTVTLITTALTATFSAGISLSAGYLVRLFL